LFLAETLTFQCICYMCIYSCGLVALALAGQLLTGCTIDPELIMSAAVTHGYTRYGEMFSGKQPLTMLIMHILLHIFINSFCSFVIFFSME